MKARLQKIYSEIAKFEKESPYNFCDRWCGRCPAETQMRCRLYLDKLEQRMTCLAHGKDEHDPAVTEAVMKRQFEEKREKAAGGEVHDLSGMDEEDPEEFDWDALEGAEAEGIKKHIEFVRNHSLPAAAETYRRRAQAFLGAEFYDKTDLTSGQVYDFNTLAWYHTLLSVKVQRGLAGFHEPVCEGDISLIDAVGQFDVCKKAIRESAEALRRLSPQYPSRRNELVTLRALLRNMESRIQALIENLDA